MDIKKLVERVVRELITDKYRLSFSPTPPSDWQFPNDHDLWMILRVGRERFVLGLVQPGVRETARQLDGAGQERAGGLDRGESVRVGNEVGLISNR